MSEGPLSSEPVFEPVDGDEAERARAAVERHFGPLDGEDDPGNEEK